MGSRIRGRESPWTHAILANYALVLHAIAAASIGIFMLGVIDGITVNYNSGEPWHRRAHLQTDDITTAVSAAAVAIRIIIGAWTARSAWRCAFILLETQGITLRQFNRMVSWPAYFLGGSTDAYIATLVMLLLAPANLVSPVITGSVGWRDVAKEVADANFPHTGPATTNHAWYAYTLRDGPSVPTLVQHAISRAGFGWVDRGENRSRSSRLVATSQQQVLPVGSTIDNLTLPFLTIHSISWDKKSDFNKNITDEFDYDERLNSRITLSGERPFNYFVFGNVVLFDEHLLDDYPKSEFNDSTLQATVPSPTVFHGVKKIAVFVALQYTTNCNLDGTIFGNKTSKANQIDLHSSVRGQGFSEACIIFGTVSFTAGVIRKQATYITPRVVEAMVDPSDPIEADNWVTETLYLLPDVMAKFSVFNISEIPTWDNLDGYVEDVIRISYQATWGVAIFWFNDSPLNLHAHKVAQKLEAVVSRPRVIGWYCAQFLVLVSAALLWMLQRRSDRPMTIDGGVVALLVDAAPILNKYDVTQELSRMSYVMEGDGEGKVRLAERRVPGSGETASLVGYDESSDRVRNPPKRFMLVPLTGGG